MDPDGAAAPARLAAAVAALADKLVSVHAAALLQMAREEEARVGPGAILLRLDESELASAADADNVYELVYIEAAAVCTLGPDACSAIVADARRGREFALLVVVEPGPGHADPQVFSYRAVARGSA